MNFSLEGLIKKIRLLASKKEPFLLAIDGRGGSGKTTFAALLEANLTDAVLIHIDDFYLPSLKRVLDKNLPVDIERVEREVLQPLRNHKETKYQRYDGKSDKMAEWHTILPKKIIIVEGWFSLHKTLMPYYDYTIWKEEDKAISLKRGVERELQDRSISIELTKQELIQRWEKYQLLEDIYITEQKPQKKATVIVR